MRADLREYLSRIATGWDDPAALDLAVASVARFVAGAAPLILIGREKVPTLARDLCRRAFDGDVRVLGPEAGARHLDAVLLLSRYEATQRLDLVAVGSGRRVVICMGDQLRRDLYLHMLRPIVVPGIRERAEDLGRIIASAMEDAAKRYGVRPLAIDSSWVLARCARCARSVAEIEIGADRIVALRAAGSMSAAAKLLGMSGPGLIGWFRRRGFGAG